jgi:hypothetical protein
VILKEARPYTPARADPNYLLKHSSLQYQYNIFRFKINKPALKARLNRLPRRKKFAGPKPAR